ncbi:hypothetical protein HOLleu_41731 [Holothuria leucospilota]|uniref:Uncharacterized protein n=1 Tax=Holothuria leucospilota TaxID=206669 RepID=A0A9Q0YBY4_HOLLE|nr:hypothetical protein HOLleu_41731 [Holothuria leucospilota]
MIKGAASQEYLSGLEQAGLRRSSCSYAEASKRVFSNKNRERGSPYSDSIDENTTARHRHGHPQLVLNESGAAQSSCPTRAETSDQNTCRGNSTQFQVHRLNIVGTAYKLQKVLDSSKTVGAQVK